MSNIMIPPLPESSAPPVPDYAHLSSYSQQPRKSYRWVWIILVLMCILGGALLALGVGFAVRIERKKPFR